MTTLTEDQIIKYTAYLNSAENAYHEFRLNGAVRVFVDQNGERVEYTAATIGGLRSYILELKTILGLPSGITGPLNVWML